MFFINNDNINKLNNGGSCTFRINWNIKANKYYSNHPFTIRSTF